MPKNLRVVLGEQARLLKGVAIQQQRHALPRGKLSALVLLVGALGAATQFQPVPGDLEIANFVRNHDRSPTRSFL